MQESLTSHQVDWTPPIPLTYRLGRPQTIRDVNDELTLKRERLGLKQSDVDLARRLLHESKRV